MKNIAIHKSINYREVILSLNPAQRAAFETSLGNPSAIKSNDLATLMKKGLVRREGTRLTVPELVRRIYGAMCEESDRRENMR